MNFRLFGNKNFKKKTTTVQSSTTLGDELVLYTVHKSTRVRYLKLTVRNGGTLRITAPRHISDATIESFIQEKSGWVLSNIAHYKSIPQAKSKDERKNEYLRYKTEALRMVQEKVLYFNSLYQFSPQAISIKNTTTLWGSCSRKGNLTFNYKIALIPGRLADYIVVHELCHLQEFNHSKQFWDLVAKTIPDHKERRKELKMTGAISS